MCVRETGARQTKSCVRVHACLNLPRVSWKRDAEQLLLMDTESTQPMP